MFSRKWSGADGVVIRFGGIDSTDLDLNGDAAGMPRRLSAVSQQASQPQHWYISYLMED